MKRLLLASTAFLCAGAHAQSPTGGSTQRPPSKPHVYIDFLNADDFHASTGRFTYNSFGGQLRLLAQSGTDNTVRSTLDFMIRGFNGPGTYFVNASSHNLLLFERVAGPSPLRPLMSAAVTGTHGSEGTVTITEYVPGQLVAGHFTARTRGGPNCYALRGTCGAVFTYATFRLPYGIDGRLQQGNARF